MDTSVHSLHVRFWSAVWHLFQVSDQMSDKDGTVSTWLSVTMSDHDKELFNRRKTKQKQQQSNKLKQLNRDTSANID